MCDEKFLKEVENKIAGLGEVFFRKMMGDYCVYLNGVLIGLACDNKFFLKKFPQNAEFLKDCEQCPPYQGAKPIYAPSLADAEYLKQAVYLTYLGALENAAAGKKRRK